MATQALVGRDFSSVGPNRNADRQGRAAALLGAVGASAIRQWLRVAGRRVAKADVPWLDGPIAASNHVGDKFYERLAATRGLRVQRNRAGSGLVPDMAQLDGPSFAASNLNAAVRDFYEHTSDYRLDVWSEARFPGRLMLWLLVTTVSRFMNQLNFPIHGLEMSRGMTSDIVDLTDGNGHAELTGWFRKVLATNRVIYTGFYMTEQPPGHDAPCIKVVFPLPRGNATVLLRPGFDGDRFTLQSSGGAFGEPGFYRLLEVDEDHWKVVHLRSLKERFEVYCDENGELRCDHRVRFMGLPMLSLHYRMTKR